MSFVLRDYQEDGVAACMEVLQAKKKKSIVVAPTGAGKSLYIAEVLKRLNEPTVILQPSKELLKQNYDKFLKMGGEATMYCSSLKVKTKNRQAYTIIEDKEIRCDEVSKFTFATVGSIKKEVVALKKLGVKTVIIDEVHLNTKEGSQMRKFIKDLGATNVLGLTATPIYLEGGLNGSRLIMINRTFATIFRSISHVTQIKSLVDKGFWTPLNYKIIKTDDSSLELNTSGSDYTEYSQKLYYESNDLKGRIVEEVKKLKEEGKKRILIFVPSIQEANELYSIIPNSAVVHSKLKPTERDFFIEAFTTGDIPVAINVNVLATGYDNPEIDAIITSRPTSSIAVFYQQVGRGVRLHPSKKECVVTDFSGNTERFGRVENITFEEIPYYGWGMFGEGDVLLSDYPIATKTKPTKQSLIESERRKQEKIPISDNPEFTFGKFAGRRFWDIAKSKDESSLKSYCVWIIEKYKKGEWTFYGQKGKSLKKAIYDYLQLPAETDKVPF